ncbi:MAG: septum formation initiator family protein [Paracoccaceae bacterium]|jgi:cell division protein FtsB|nr:septum formation initiator family protein [Paracoccaceae bacterium]MDP7186879.1 septum formation initiator family protein [Paracoccaceae bacterium]
MDQAETRSRYRLLGLFSLALAASLYFAFAAVQGEYGLFRRAEVKAEIMQQRLILDALTAELEQMENLTTRLSDTFLDLDLLDQQARDILGYARPNELVLD